MSIFVNTNDAKATFKAGIRVPREFGFGDFAFGRLVKTAKVVDGDWNWDQALQVVQGTELEQYRLYVHDSKQVAYPLQEWSMQDFLDKSHVMPYAELNGFIRTGVFQLMKLPAETRQNILKLLLEACFVFNEATQQDIFEIHIAQNPESSARTNLFTGDTESYLRQCEARSEWRGDRKVRNAKRSAGGPLSGLSDDDITSINHQFARLAASASKSAQRHPQRMVPYEIMLDVKTVTPMTGLGANSIPYNTFYNSRQSIRAQSRGVDYPLIELIRNISNLSVTVRQDLAAVLWKNSRLIVAHDMATSPLFVGFLLDRPAIYAGIRSVSLGVVWHRYHRHYEEQDNMQFDLTCQLLTRLTNLAELELDFGGGFDQDMAKELQDDIVQHGILKIVRAVSVSKTFKVKFKTSPTIVTNPTVMVRYREQITAALLPDSLRIQAAAERKIDLH